MKKAIGTFNGWRCPACKRLVAKPEGDRGKCKSCGEELLFGLTPKESEGVDIPVKILRSVDEHGRPIMVNFLNRPQLLKTFEKFGKERELFLSEVVIGFAAKGFKQYLEEHKVNANKGS